MICLARSIAVITFAFPLTLSIPPDSAAQATADPGLLARVDSVLAPWNRDDSPGCAVGVDRAGAPLVRRAVGLANLETGTRWTVGTISESGSVAKQFVAAAAVLLALDRKLTLDEDVSRWVPELRGINRRITLRQLLSHTSGIPDRYTLHEIDGRPAGEVDHPNAEVMALVARLRDLNFEPGDDYLYSNTGYVIAVTVLERVSGRSLQQLTDERIFKPLGMAGTRWREDHRVVVPGRAAAYSGTRERGFRNDHPFTRVFGSGGLLTTVDDFLRWQNALLTGATPWNAVRDSLEQAAVLNDGTVLGYGLGMRMSKLRGVRQVYHTGSTGGYRAALSRFPEQRLAVALLCNLGSVDPEVVARRVAEAVLGSGLAAAEPAAGPVAIDTATMARLAGVYHAPRTEQVLRLEVRDGRLLVEGRPAIPRAPDRYGHPPGDETLVVVPGRPGARPGLRLEAPGSRPVEYAPVEPPIREPGGLAPYAGVYRSPELGAEYRIALEKDTLRLFRGWREPGQLIPVYRDGFSFGNMYIRFARDSAGRVGGFVVWAGRVRHHRFERVEAEAVRPGGR